MTSKISILGGLWVVFEQIFLLLIKKNYKNPGWRLVTFLVVQCFYQLVGGSLVWLSRHRGSLVGLSRHVPAWRRNAMNQRSKGDVKEVGKATSSRALRSKRSKSPGCSMWSRFNRFFPRDCTFDMRTGESSEISKNDMSGYFPFAHVYNPCYVSINPPCSHQLSWSSWSHLSAVHSLIPRPSQHPGRLELGTGLVRGTNLPLDRGCSLDFLEPWFLTCK